MNNEDAGTFCERINHLFRRFQSRPGMRGTQKEYRERLGVSEGQLKGWLLGKSEPSFDTLKKIARIEGVSVGWLIGEESPATDNSPAAQLYSRLSRADAQTVAQTEQFLNYLEYQKQVSEGENKGTGT
ncbi:helix-turn-helix domain-containing protein [Selenomonas ruminantium]|uniref:Transcriptional regulator, contains XRE-family HTH domain n=1 Tax=Selenomonas ruminantium TaxID=971 RepID=A0A1H0MYY8_SELRU|nr:helix-turn-helix transcriptional regulator [Selenomonas ruminantium]SDO85330.1 Transcriptional regulator, contains XRE-family HTH domain [Selenomonas ruminantium]